MEPHLMETLKVIVAVCVSIILLIPVVSFFLDDIVKENHSNKIGIGENMNLLELLNGLVTQINALQQALVDAQGSADALAQAKYNEGFADGVKSVPPAGDKIYSQVEFDAAINPLKDQVNSLMTQVSSLEMELQGLKDNMQPKIDEAVSLAKAEFKLVVLAAYEAAQSDENLVEGALKDKLANL